LGKPLRAVPGDDETFEGIGQIQIDFLGECFVIGCVEGEEDKALLRAHKLEVNAGEVLKAVNGELDLTRAMLMAGILAYERIEELEGERRLAPAADRVVPLDHNSPDYFAATAALEQLIEVVRESNSYHESDPDDQNRRLGELEAGRRLLGSRWISMTTLKASLWGTIAYLASKFIDAPIGEAASLAWSTLKKLFGLG
jgi:cell division protein ZapA (FtsZ GTPase activity inhibitor)